MFSKILVATDLSKASDEVICTLASLKALGTRAALLLECLNVRDVGGLAGSLAEHMKPKLEQQRERVARQGLESEARVVLGLPHLEINRQADLHGCSLIVIGARGATGLRELLLGSVASAVLHHSTKPVLVLRVNGGPSTDNAPCEPSDCDLLRNILFPTDFSDNAEFAYRHVQELARHGARLITLLHVLPIEATTETRALAAARLQRLDDELRKLGSGEVVIELVAGSAKQEVLERTRGDAHSLVVIGSQGLGYLPGAVLGSVSHAVAYRATAPVLFVPMFQQ